MPFDYPELARTTTCRMIVQKLRATYHQSYQMASLIFLPLAFIKYVKIQLKLNLIYFKTLSLLRSFLKIFNAYNIVNFNREKRPSMDSRGS